MRWPVVIATSALEGPGLSELYQRWLVMSLVPVAYVMYACCMHTPAHLPCPVLILHGEHPCLNYDACNRRLWPCLYAHLKPRESNFPARIAEASLLHDVECRLGLSTKVIVYLLRTGQNGELCRKGVRTASPTAPLWASRAHRCAEWRLQ